MDILLPGMVPAINAETCRMVTAAMQSATAEYPDMEYNHQDFLEFARSNGMSERILQFLTERGNLAGATPNAWMRLSNVAAQDWHADLDDTTRREVTKFIIGHRAFNNYVDWFLEGASASIRG